MDEVMKKLGRVKADSIDADAGELTAVINSGQTDRMAEQLDPMGCDWKNYMKNPVVQWAHNHDAPPIGKTLNITKDPDEGVVARVKFAVDEDPFAARVFRLYQGGYLSAFSVCFMPKKRTIFEEDTDEWKDGLRLRYDEWELLEHSPVPIPCDPNALAKGLALVAGDASTRAAIKTMTQHGELPDVELKRVVPFKHFPLAPEDTRWSFSAADGNAILERGGWDLYGQCHSYVDPDADPETKAAYKLPHTKIIGDRVVTVWRGVAAATQRIGSADIPESEKERILSAHLFKHYKEFDKDPPPKALLLDVDVRRAVAELVLDELRRKGYTESPEEVLSNAGGANIPPTELWNGPRFQMAAAELLKVAAEFLA